MADKTDFEKKKERHASGESTMSTDSVTNYIPTPPDGGYGWVIVFASFINHIIVDGIAFTFGIFYIAFLDYFKESSNRTALVGSILAGCYLLSGAVASALVNKFGCRIVCVIGSLIATSGFLLSTLAPSISILYLTYGVMGGCGLGLIYLPSVISVSYYFQRRRAVATGIAVCGAGVGCFIFAPAGRLLLERYDWKNAMMFLAGITLNAAVCGMLMRPLENPRKKRPREKNVLDRLLEQARSKIGRKRCDSEPGNGAYSTTQANDEIMQKVQEVKLARLKMLKEEDGDSVLSFPNSVMNSARKLDDSRGNSRTNSLVARDSSRHGSLGVEAVSPGSTLPRIRLEDEDLKERSNEDLTLEEPMDISMPPTPEQETVPFRTEKNGRINGLLKGSQEAQRIPNAQGTNGHVKFADGHVNGFGSLNVVANGKQNGKCETDTTPNGILFPENGMNNHGKKANSTMEVTDFFLQIPRKRNTKPAGVRKDDYARPMYRKDIFYSGSIIHINHFRSQPNMRSYMRSVTSIPAAVPPEKESKIWRCLHVPKEAKDTLKDMLDITLFLDPVFLIACLANAFGFIGLFVPFIFMPQRAMSLGIDDSKAAFLLSVVGITNTGGRVLAGWLADRDGINPLILHNLAIVFGGIACILNMFATSYAGMCVFAAFFGLCVATWISLTSIILCNLLGLQKLTNAFGLLTMTRGMASIAGPPFAGFMFDATQNYNAAFHLGGAVLTVSGLIFCLLHLPYFQRYNAERDLELDEEQTVAEIPDDILLDNESSDNMDHIDLEKENVTPVLTAEFPQEDSSPNGNCPV